MLREEPTNVGGRDDENALYLFALEELPEHEEAGARGTRIEADYRREVKDHHLHVWMAWA